jgi:hypothetical protein
MNGAACLAPAKAGCFYDDERPLPDNSRRLHRISPIATAVLPATFWIEQAE